MEVEIERILPGGVGLAHAEGMTLFVSLAAPRDLVRVEIDRIRGKIAFASIREILKPSPLRVEPPCPYFGRCGGCDFQQLGYEDQLEAKLEIIRDCLHRIARIEHPPEIKIHPSPAPWAYRSRANWQVDPGLKQLGYFERGSRRICDVEYCAVLEPELQQALQALRKALPDLPGGLREISATVGDEGLSVKPPLAGFETVEVSRRIGAESYLFSAAAFFQTNYGLLEPLVLAAIADDTGEVAIDLYSGVGLFTIPLGRRFKHVTAIESNPISTSFARKKIRHAQLPNVEIVTANVAHWFSRQTAAPGPVDLILLDPPRTGAENNVIAGILNSGAGRISYVSCDPATLARDLKKLIAGGYLVDSIQAFDMFPQTHHIEAVTRLIRTG